MKKIAFIINSLSFGGAEKALVNLCNNLVNKGYTIEVFSLLRGKQDISNQFSNDVKIHFLIKNNHTFLSKFHYKFLLLFGKKRLYRKFQNFDYIVSFLEGVPFYLLSLFKTNKPIKKYAFIHTTSSLYKAQTIKMYGNKFREIDRYVSSFDKIICVSEDIKHDFLLNFSNNNSNVIVLPNILDIQKINNLSNVPLSDFNFEENIFYLCYVGRLVKIKQLDLMLDIIKGLDDVHLIVIGDGEDKENLLAIASKDQIKNVSFLGFKPNPYPYIKQSNAMICTSLTEGLNTSIYEGLFLEKPFISTDVGGISFFLRDYRCGLIANSKDQFCEIIESFKNKKLYQNIKSNAEKMSERISSSALIDEYIKELFV